MPKKIVSFGFKHGLPPFGNVAVDVRIDFYNPYHCRGVRDLTGLDPIVGELIEKRTFRFQDKYKFVRDFVSGIGPESDAYIGCTGGKHRSVYLADRIGRELGVPVEHRDIDR